MGIEAPGSSGGSTTAPYLPVWRPGWWYDITSAIWYGAQQSDQGRGVDLVSFVPVAVPSPTSVDRIATKVSSVVSEYHLRFGIYSSGPTGLPHALVAETDEVTGSAIAVVDAPITAALVAGTYWLALQVLEGSDVGFHFYTMPNTHLFGVDTPGGSGSPFMLHAQHAYGPMPATVVPTTVGDFWYYDGDPIVMALRGA